LVKVTTFGLSNHDTQCPIFDKFFPFGFFLLGDFHQTPDEPIEMFDQQYKITAPSEILDVLTEASEIRASVKIGCEGAPAFRTWLIGFYKGHLLFDRPKDINPAVEVKKGDRIEVRYYPLGTGVYEFETEYIGSVDATSQCLTEIPRELVFVQRRDSYRVVPARSLPADVVSLLGRQAKATSRIENISITGACLSFPNEIQVRIGMVVPAICLLLNNDSMVELEGVIRASWSTSDGRFCLGLEWRHTNAEERRILKNYLVASQRFEIRRKLA
jgi:c-di-GMP-binding flagellar brake protein YcgR